MRIDPVRTRLFQPPHDDITDGLATAFRRLRDRSILVVSSKVVSIWEGRCLPADGARKDRLIRLTSSRYLPRSHSPHGHVMHTITHGVLIPSAGIDESNAGSYVILLPKDPAVSARRIWRLAREETGLDNLGVIVADSHSVPLHRGVMGVSLAHWGIQPLRDYRGRPDLFGRPFKVSISNIPDALAAAAVLVMGEGSEQTPFAVATDLPRDIRFVRRMQFSANQPAFQVPLRDDLFRPFLARVRWRRGKEM